MNIYTGMFVYAYKCVLDIDASQNYTLFIETHNLNIQINLEHCENVQNTYIMLHTVLY